jgi:hypothetical protein
LFGGPVFDEKPPLRWHHVFVIISKYASRTVTQYAALGGQLGGVDGRISGVKGKAPNVARRSSEDRIVHRDGTRVSSWWSGVAHWLRTVLAKRVHVSVAAMLPR